MCPHRLAAWLAALVQLVLCAGSVTRVGGDTFAERMHVWRAGGQHVAASMHFDIESDSLALGPSYDLFPKVLADVLNAYAIGELHMTLTQGYWRNDQWRTLPGAQASAPTGARLTVAFDTGDGLPPVDERWASTVHSLSGYFCASLSQIVAEHTGRPQVAHRPLGLMRNGSSSYALRHAELASESMCTENLTPWKKLLPCKRRGLAIALNAIALAAAPFASVQVHLSRRPAADRAAHSVWRAELVVLAVFDVLHTQWDWNTRDMFEATVAGACPLAQRSHVLLTLPPHMTIDVDYAIRSAGVQPEVVSRGSGAFATFDLKALSQPFYAGIVMHKRQMPRWEADVRMHSYVAGTGFQGRIKSVVRNAKHAAASAVYMHQIPWFLRVYTHTLAVYCGGARGGAARPRHVHKAISLGRDRVRPTVIELALVLPPQSTCTVSVLFEKAFLKWNEYPPDANRGFPIPAAVLHVRLNDTEGVRGEPHSSPDCVSVYAEALLVPMPTPDFSMPYNVICFVCTVIAVCFGPIHTLSTKSLCVYADDGEPSMAKKVALRLRSALAAIRCRLCRGGGAGDAHAAHTGATTNDQAVGSNRDERSPQ